MTTQAMSAYRSHDLNITMKTSSGDVIELDLSNEQSLRYAKQEGNGSRGESLKFSSMQSFSFSMQTRNGIDEQDKKEIAAFMKIAQPYLDNFLKELKEDAPRSPVNKVAQQIADLFLPAKAKNEDVQTYAKSSIVKLFDDAMERNAQTTKSFDELFASAKKLLEKTLWAFEKEQKELYA